MSGREVPWRFNEMLILYVTTAVGLLLIAGAWWATSGTTDQLHQIPWVNVGVFGVIVLGTGNCFWLLAGRRAVGERRRTLLDSMVAAAPLTAVAPVVSNEGPSTNGTAPTGPELVWVEGMTHYHRPTCQLVVGKAASSAAVAVHQRAGRAACGMCRP